MVNIVTIKQLAERYDTLLFDSYGVLVNELTGLPGAAKLIRWLETSGKNYLIVTNDASRSIDSRAGKFIDQGVPVPAERIVNSGILIPRFFIENELNDVPTAVFGSADAIEYARSGGANVLPLEKMQEAEVFVLADDAGFDWRPRMNALVSVLNRKVQDHQKFTLLLPNPDLIYSSGEREYSFAAAALAEMIESALTRLFGPSPNHRFIRLGKPFTPIFDEARRRAESLGTGRSLVMIGDQMETDIAGAVAYGIDSAVVASGINRLHTTAELEALPPEFRPTYLIESIEI